MDEQIALQQVTGTAVCDGAWTLAGLFSLIGWEQQREKILDHIAALRRVTQRLIAVDLVAVLASIPEMRDVARSFEIHHNPLNGPLGDTDQARNFARGDLLVTRDTKQHLRVIGQKGPACHGIRDYTTYRLSITQRYKLTDAQYASR